MATTYEKIATTTLGSSVSSITFSSVAASWTDLRLVVTGRQIYSSINYGSMKLIFNSDSGSNYSYTRISGNGSAASSSSATSQTYLYGGYFADAPTGNAMTSLFVADIFSYAGSTYKTILCNSSVDENGSGVTDSRVGLWQSTSAITSINISGGDGNIDAGTTATLYGIKAA